MARRPRGPEPECPIRHIEGLDFVGTDLVELSPPCSADRNPWHAIAVVQGRAIDKTPPPWRRSSTPAGFPLAAQAEFFDAPALFYQRLDSLSEDALDVAAATFLAAHGRREARRARRTSG